MVSSSVRRHFALVFAFFVLAVSWGITRHGLFFWSAIAVLPAIAANYWFSVGREVRRWRR